MLRPTLSRRVTLLGVAAAGLMSALAHGAEALPQRDLVVELRAVAAAASGGSAWDLGTADASRERITAQRVRVGNGRSASIGLGVSRPVQTWQALPGVWRGVAAPATQWISAGQALVVEPRWPGGARPVTVTLRATASRFDPTVAPGSAAPPERRDASLETTVDVGLGEWIVIATSGGAATTSGQGIGTRDTAAQALQLRVSLAP